MNTKLTSAVLCVGLVTLLALRVVAAEQGQSAADVEFQRGFYLQTHQHDPVGAASAFVRSEEHTSELQSH